MNNTPSRVLFFPVTETTVPESFLLQLKGILFGGYEKPIFIEQDQFIKIPDIYDSEFDSAFKKVLLEYKVSEIITTHLATFTKLEEMGLSQSTNPKLLGKNTATVLNSQHIYVHKVMKRIEEQFQIDFPIDPAFLTSLFLLSQGVPGSSNFEKMLILFLLSSQVKRGFCVEIGVHLGKSAIAIAAGANLSESHFLAVDTWDDEKAIQLTADTILKKASKEWNRAINYRVAEKNIEFFNQASLVYRGDSCQAIEEWTTQGILKRQNVNFIHFDANHDFDSILKDFNHWRPLLSKKNYVVFDDTSWRAGQGPKMFVELLKEKAEYANHLDIAGSTIFWDLQTQKSENEF